MTIDYRAGEIFDPLTDAEQVALRDAEEQINRGLNTFVAVGTALESIRSERLYRATHDTFSLYCLDRWGMNYRHANRLIEAANTVEAMGPIGPVPTTESQARELAGLDPQNAAIVMRQAHENTGGRVTAAAIREARAPEPVAEGEAVTGSGQTPTPQDESAPSPSLPDEMASRPPVIGLDGRTYPRSTPAADRRRPITDTARDLGVDLRKLVERVERLRADDRFDRNKNEVAAHLRHHLAHAVEVLTDLEEQINSLTGA